MTPTNPTRWQPSALALNGRLHAFRLAAKQAVFLVDRPKAPFKPVFEVATTREESEVVLVHDPDAEPQKHGNSVLVAA